MLAEREEPLETLLFVEHSVHASIRSVFQVDLICRNTLLTVSSGLNSQNIYAGFFCQKFLCFFLHHVRAVKTVYLRSWKKMFCKIIYSKKVGTDGQ